MSKRFAPYHAFDNSVEDNHSTFMGTIHTLDYGIVDVYWNYSGKDDCLPLGRVIIRYGDDGQDYYSWPVHLVGQIPARNAMSLAAMLVRPAAVVLSSAINHEGDAA